MHEGSKLNPLMLLYVDVTDILFVFLNQEKLKYALVFCNKTAFKIHRFITLLGTCYYNKQIFSIFLQCIPEDSEKESMYEKF